MSHVQAALCFYGRPVTGSSQASSAQALLHQCQHPLDAPLAETLVLCQVRSEQSLPAAPDHLLEAALPPNTSTWREWVQAELLCTSGQAVASELIMLTALRMLPLRSAPHPRLEEGSQRARSGLPGVGKDLQIASPLPR